MRKTSLGFVSGCLSELSRSVDYLCPKLSGIERFVEAA